ncbi:hypothetical protein ACHAWF_011152 [Thalassiosira exigua]
MAAYFCPPLPLPQQCAMVNIAAAETTTTMTECNVRSRPYDLDAADTNLCGGDGPSAASAFAAAAAATVAAPAALAPAARVDVEADDETDDDGVPQLVRSHSSRPRFFSSPSMEFNLIREEDADILELGVEEKRGADLADFDDEGRRLEVVARCESELSLDELEGGSPVEGGGLELFDVRRSQGSRGSQLGAAVDEPSNDDFASSPLALPLHAPPGNYGSGAALSENLSMPAISEHVSCDIPHPQSHSLDMVESTPQENLSEENDYFLGTTSPQTTSKPQMEDEALSKRINHQRSASFDRRLHESAQFAEAVGEEPDTLLLKKIIEEDSSSDFDDDEIDEAGGNLMPGEEVEGEEILVDFQAGQSESLRSERHAGLPERSATTQTAGAPSQEKDEPTCVSTDVAKVSLKTDEDVVRTVSQQPGESPQLPTPIEAEIVDSEPPTTDPSPRKHKSMSCPPSAFHSHFVDWKFIRQNTSSSNNLEANAPRHRSTPSGGECDLVFRGIHAKRLEITKRGMARGNYALLHRKAWLEVSDKHHRYGKNLRMYYKRWEALGHPYHMFFDWLDSKGEARGEPLPDVPEIPRPVLDSDTVLYITDSETTASYALDVVVDPADGSAIIVDKDGNPINTGKEGWIFVIRDHVLYGSQKVTAPNNPPESSDSNGAPAKSRQRFHHSSFFGGKAVASAGIFLTNEQGRMTRLYPHSGHYRPGESHMQRALFFFQKLGVELSTFSVDMQQIFKVSRKTAPGKEGEKAKGEKDKENVALVENGKPPPIGIPSKFAQGHAKKSKKTDCLHLMCGLEVACFLANKALMIERGVFHQIHQIRRIYPKELRDSVGFILGFVN